MSSGIEQYCGSKFWDLDSVWNTESPDFTDCFQKTVLVWAPCGFLWLFAGIEVYFMVSSTGRNIPWSWLNIMKTIANLVIIATSVADLVWALDSTVSAGYDVYDADRYTPVIKLATFVLALTLTLAGKRRGIRTSGILFIFWLILTICGIITYRSQIMKIVGQSPALVEFTFVTTMVYFPMVVLLLFLNCFSDDPPMYKLTDYKSDRPSPELSASFLSKVTFSWLDPLAWKGYRKPLDMKDLWDLKPSDSSSVVIPRFDKHWNKALFKAAAKSASSEEVKYSGANGTVNFEERAAKRPKPISIAPTLLKTFGVPLAISGLLKLFADVLAFVSPQIQRLLIDFTESEDEQWKGFLYAGILTVTAVIQTILNAQHYRAVYVVGMGVRTSVTSIVYRKSLKISNTARRETTVGEIVNLMAVDAQRLMEMALYLNLLWSTPLTIGIALYFLYQTLGPSIFAGLGVMLLLIPINGVIATKTRTLQMQQMKNKDKRVKLINEILNGMKVLKLYAWEPSFQAQVEEIRKEEVKVLKKSAYLSAGTSVLWTCAPFLVALTTFAVYVLSDPNNVLDASKAFVALTLFNIMNMPMALLPMLIVASVQAAVSLKRMNKFLNAEELDPNAVTHDESERNPISVKNGSFTWTKDDEPVLSNINLEVEQGSLVAVVGQVGCGKSSLVSALLGEMEKRCGTINTKGSIAYVPQQAWIQNCTLKDNILFGLNDSPRYNQVVEACALRQDLDMLPGGDTTEIGEKGINLSGGQKQRISLARAVYCDKDMYFLDDPLSAVDSHVGKHIFDNVVGPKGMLKNKTRILVTHGITYLPQTDKIVVLKDGLVSEVGSYKELLAKKGDFADFLIEHLTQQEVEEEGLEDIQEIRKELENTLGREKLEKLTRERSHISESHSRLSVDGSIGNLSPNGSISKKGGSLRRNGSIKLPKEPEVDKKEDKLIEAEKSETGSVKIAVYVHYMRSVGVAVTFGTFFLYAIYQVCAVGANLWLSAWSNSYPVNSTTGETLPIDTSERDLYLGVYGALGFGQGIFSFVASVTCALGTIKASVYLHNTMLGRLMKSPMSFFDTTPLGRIVNRFAKDVDVVDNTIPMSLRMCITMLLSVVGTMVVISYSTPIFLVVILPIGVLYYVMQFIYVSTSRQLKRLESVTRSPIYSHFGETISGAHVIRAYSQEMRFIKESETRVDLNQTCYYPSIMANRWLSVRLETIGNFVVFFASVFAVLSRSTLSAGIVGLSISYSLSVTQTLNMFVRMTSEVETNIVSVERMKEYSEASQEKSWETAPTQKKPPKDWPQEGNIEFRNLQLRYREGLELVLKGISVNIKGGERIGIVGRTGAGKSSLTLGLFRIVEPAGGTILIDGLDICEMGLHSLRSRLTIIPQDPVLFSGTLRINLDPFGQHKDEEIWNALELAHLKTFTTSLTAGLSHEIAEGGENLSVGQRQLICLARALLRKTKILILDEATAAVDLETDDLIQATIRKEFADCTVLTIAHRLNTIMDSTRVLVLDKGEVREFDAPDKLLANPSTIFYGMAKDANLVQGEGREVSNL